jgi:flagella basal body P-ring formation protein FlgA
LPREIVLAALRAALTGVGAGDDLEIDLSGFAAPMVPPSAAISAGIEQLDWDAASGRFTGQLTLTAEGMAMQRLRIAGAAQDMIAIPVPVHRLNPGAVIQADDLRMARVRAGLARGEVARGVDQAVGLTLRRQVSAGQPLALGDLTRTPMIQKGARVTMRLRAPGLSASALGQALEPGSSGEHIRVLNIGSRAVVEAEVIGPDEVRVIPGSQPVVAANNRTAALGLPTVNAQNWSTP